MGLVKIADEYERLLNRDLQAELQDESISRRKKVAIEDDIESRKLSQVIENPEGDYQGTSVTFRHLAMLAQIKKDDSDVITSLQKMGAIDQASPALLDRLARMRNWVDSTHFPEELKIELLEQINEQAVNSLTPEAKRCIPAILANLTQCEWTADAINGAIPQAARDLELSPREAYSAAYGVLMGKAKGPRLAPILVEVERASITGLFQAATEHVRV